MTVLTHSFRRRRRCPICGAPDQTCTSPGYTGDETPQPVIVPAAARAPARNRQRPAPENESRERG